MAQAKKAALLAKAAALKGRHALEEKEERLAKEREEIRRQKETLNFEAELSAANAKLAVLSGALEQVAVSTPADGMNNYLEERNMELANMDKLQAVAHTTNLHKERVVRPKDRMHHMPLFQARIGQGLQGDHRGHWLLQET